MTARTCRRDLLGGGASLMLLTAAAAGATKAEELDGPLLVAATEYARLEDEYCVASYREDEMPKGPDRDAIRARMDAIFDRQQELFEAMCNMPARTPEGLRAKCLAVRCVIGDGDSRATKSVDRENWLTFSLLDDLLGRSGT